MKDKKYILTERASHCPVCSAERGRVLYSVNPAEAAQHYVLREVYPERNRALQAHIEQLWQQPSCDLVQCSECGFCFADPFVAGDAYFYDLAYDRSSYPTQKWEFDRTLSSLYELRAKGRLEDARLLEVGAGDGSFVKQASPAIVAKKNVLCTEYSDYGAASLAAYGIECLRQDIRDLPSGEYEGLFDIICMFQVLEHLDRLHDLFEQLGVLSSDGAHLFIAVPNPRRIEFDELNGGLLDLPPNHVGRWSRSSFEVMARLHGWRLVEHEVEVDRLTAKLSEFVLYRYMRKRQDPHTVANRIERLPRHAGRRILQAAAVALYAGASAQQIFSLSKTPGLGASQWAHLQNTSST